MKLNIVGGAVLVSVLLQGCASSSKSITPQYVSPLQYQNHSCSQLAQEAQRVSSRVAQVSGVQDKKATNDALITTAAVILFWPAAFFVSGDGNNAAELGKLKGEFDTIEKVAIKKNCNLQIRRAPKKRKKKWRPNDDF